MVTFLVRSIGAWGARMQGERTAWEGACVPVAFALFWLVSLVRVIGALLRHEVFGADATLALMAVVALPFVVLERRGSGSARTNEAAPPLA